MNDLTGICFFGPLLMILPVGLAWLGLVLYQRVGDRRGRADVPPVASCSLVVGSLGVMSWCLMSAILRNWVVQGLHPAWVALSDWYARLTIQGQATAKVFGLVGVCGGGIALLAMVIALTVWGWRWYRARAVAEGSTTA